MAVIFQTTDLTNTSVSNELFSDTGSPSVTIGSGDEVIVADDVFLGSGAGIIDLANATQFDFTMLGTGYSIGTGIRLDLNTSQTDDFDFDYRVHIGPDASLTTREALGFIGVLSTASGVRDAGSKVEFVNDGTMASISNSGLSFQTIGVAALTNNGSISSADTNNTVSFKNIGTAKLFNNGEITTQNVGIGTFSTAINFSSSTENSFFVNTGTVSSAGSAYYSSASVSEYFANSGTIIGRIDTSTVTDTELRNTGTIIGDVDTNFGNDTVINTGTIQGFLDLGGNDDRYRASGDGNVTDTILGGSGNDTITGGAANDIIDGGTDDDLIIGGGGDDTIDGGDGNEDIFGGAGEDSITGGTGTDNLRGNSGSDYIDGGDELDLIRGGDGNDTLLGGDGNDTINGGNGDDEITAGLGKDVMRGNRGEDVFVFTDALDSTVADADRIRDFQSGQDLIDLSAITTFDFIGSAGFSGTGAELRFQTTGSGLRIEMDVDGDGSADMRVNMNNISVLTTEDFIL